MYIYNYILTERHYTNGMSPTKLGNVGGKFLQNCGGNSLIFSPEI